MNTFLDVFGAYNYLVRDSLTLVLLGLSIYLMLNAGLFAVPQVGFMAVGGYTGAILSTRYHAPLVASLLGAALAGAVVGLILGAALARLDGVYLAIATIAFAEMVRVTIRNLGITGGPTGLVGIPRSVTDFELVGIVVIATVALVRVNRTRAGAACVAMREDQLMAAHQGVNLRRYRVALFVGSGILAGLAGALRAHLNGFIVPSAFDFALLVQMLTATILGGMATVAGPWVGSIVIFGGLETLRHFQGYRNTLDALLIIVVIAFAPSGLTPILRVGVARAVALAQRRGSSRKVAAEPASGLRAVPAPPALSVVAAADPSDATGRDNGAPEESILVVDRLSKHFGGVTAVRDVSLELRRGETFGLIGPNGSGKTTILNLLSGVYAPDTGSGTIDGVSMDSLWGRPERLTRAGVARTFQNIRLVGGSSVFENVLMGAYLNHGASFSSTLLGASSGRRASKRVQGLVGEALDLVEIRSIAGVDVDTLPYGLKRKVEIARALVHQPSVLLLDEPTAGMSPAERAEIFELVETIRRGGTTIVVVEHDVSSITAYCDRAAVLNFGEVIASGRAQSVIAEEVVIDAYIGRVARG